MVKLFHKGIKIGHEYPFARLRAAILLGTWFGDDPGPLIAWKGFVNKVLQLVSFNLKALYIKEKQQSSFCKRLRLPNQALDLRLLILIVYTCTSPCV